MSHLFSKTTLGSLTLANHLLMAPMTRNRATGNIPNELMAQYYAQRATAGLIITEGTSPSPNGLGYPRIPGIFSAEQIAGWKQITDAVHAQGGKMFMQLMHCGRIAHPGSLRRLRRRARRGRPGGGQGRSDCRGETVPCQPRSGRALEDGRGCECAGYEYVLYARTQGLYRLPGARLIALGS